MTTIDLYVQGAAARARVNGDITEGMVGIPVRINCDHTWDGLVKTFVCMTAHKKIPIVLGEHEPTVAWEVLVQGMHLYLGLEGRDAAGDIVIPTVWADCGKIQAGADHSHTGKPTPNEMEQLLRIAENIILVQDQQPTVEENKAWLKPEEEEFDVPEWKDVEELLRMRETLVCVSENEPEFPETKLWLKPEEEEFDVPEWKDVEELLRMRDTYDAAIKRNEDSINGLNEDLAKLDGRVTVLENEPKVPESLVEQVDDNTRSLDELKKTVNEEKRINDFRWKVQRGQTWDIESVECEGHAQLPDGGEYGNVDEVYGKTEQGENPSPDNPQEIHSVEEIRVKRTGKNLLDANNMNIKSYWLSGDGIARSNTFRTAIVAVQPNTRYVISNSIGFIRGWIAETSEYPAEGLSARNIGNSATTYQQSIAFTTGATAKYIVIPLLKADSESYSLSQKAAVTQLEYGSVATAYESFHEELRTITPPRPLNAIGEYRDKCDVVNGAWEYAITRTQEYTFLNWYREADLIRSQPSKYPRAAASYTCLSPQFVGATSWGVLQGSQSVAVITAEEGANIRINSDALADIAALRARFTEEDPLVVYYPLYTPTTEPIATADLEWLRNLTLLPGENLFITDNHGRDVSYLMSDFINLGKVGG